MKSLRIRHLVLYRGMPKVAVSITASDQIELKRQLNQVLGLQPDLVEWRLDALKSFPTPRVVRRWLRVIRHVIKSWPLLATFRTTNEGGRMPADEQHYFGLLQQLARDSRVDLLDQELRHNPLAVHHIVQLAHQHGVDIIMSYHNFRSTPASGQLLTLMQRMQQAQADLAKVAVMPRSRADVLRFMQTSYRADQKLRIPVVTMAMGELGKLTRISGALTGSVITFGSLNSHVNSAAGQIPVPQLKSLLKWFPFKDKW